LFNFDWFLIVTPPGNTVAPWFRPVRTAPQRGVCGYPRQDAVILQDADKIWQGAESGIIAEMVQAVVAHFERHHGDIQFLLAQQRGRAFHAELAEMLGDGVAGVRGKDPAQSLI
jgi:hypothetical protein